MQITRKLIPEREDPNKRTKEKEEQIIMEQMKELSNALAENEDSEFIPDVAVDIKEKEFRPKVSLSWKRNVETVIKWMEEHMEPYSETHEGFLVDFIDDSRKKWYEVVPYYIYDKWIVEVVLKWKTYKILEHTFSQEEYEMYKRLEWWVETTNFIEGIKESTVKDLNNTLEDWKKEKSSNKDDIKSTYEELERLLSEWNEK